MIGGSASDATTPTGSWRTSAFAALAVALGAVVYVNALHNPFVYDDHRTILDNASIRTLSDIRAIVLRDVARPMVNISYAIDYAIWGPGPFGFHLTSVLLHLVNVALLFAVALRLVRDREMVAADRSAALKGPPYNGRAAETAGTSGPPYIAFVAATLFALHALLTEAVGYISGRSEVLCATFFLLAFLAGRRWMRHGGAGWWLATMTLWALALLTKETAVMLPIVLVCYDAILLDNRNGDRRRRVWWLHAPVLAAAAAVGIARLAVFLFVERPASGTTHALAVFDEARVVWRYLALFVAPSGQSIFHEVPLTTSWLDPRGWIAAAALVAVAALAWRARRADRLAAFGVLWFFLLLVPSSLIVVLDEAETMAEHRVYIASLGLFLVAGSLIASAVARLVNLTPRTRLLVYGAVGAVIFALAGRTVLRNVMWASPVRIWQEAANLAPDSYTPRTVLGESLHDAGRHSEAIAEYEAALRREPDDAVGYLKLGICLAETGRFDEARATFERLRQRHPRSPIVTTGLGAIEMIAGRPERARPYFDETLAHNPNDVMARQWLAVLEEDAAGDPAAALRRCEEIQRLAPGKLTNEDCIRRNRARLAAVDAARRH